MWAGAVMPQRIAFLVFKWGKKGARKAIKAFDYFENVGAYMVIDDLRRNHGIEMEFCTPESAHKFDIVLVSLTSEWDIYNFLGAVMPEPTWKPGARTFKVIMGGFGMQNVAPVRSYVDYAVYGRAEGMVGPLILEYAVNGDPAPLDNVMNLPEITPVKMRQAPEFYPHELDIRPHPRTEKMIGCPNRCYFCHYTFSRKYVSTPNAVGLYNDVKGLKSQPEIALKEMAEMWDPDVHKGGILSSIDGFSERLRFAFNKHIKNQDLIDAVELLSEGWQGKKTIIHLYNIGSYPTETDADVTDFKDTVAQIRVTGKPVVIVMRLTPYEPSLCTPGQWLPANIEKSWWKWAGKRIYTGENMQAVYFQTISSAYTHLEQIIINRATEDSDGLIQTILFNTRLKSMGTDDKVRALRKKYNLTPYLRQYSPAEELPAWYLRSFTAPGTLRRMHKRLLDNLGMEEM